VDLLTSLHDLTNVAAFARAPAWREAMISTFDRTGGNDDWSTPQALGPNGEWVIADLKGPGEVSRIWATSVGVTEWQFYFDGESHPRIRCSGAGLFGRESPFSPPLCDILSSGSYCYLPIPYGKSLRIVGLTSPFTASSRRYYHVNYSTYRDGVNVTSFPPELSGKENAALDAAHGAWSSSMARPLAPRPEVGSAEVDRGGTAVLLDRRGAGTVEELTLRTSPSGEGSVDEARLLRDLVLEAYWDGSRSPSVQVPLGDFFCQALFTRDFGSLPMVSSNGWMTCRFPMPFRTSARIAVRNDAAHSARVEWGVRVALADAATPRRYFHARWGSGLDGRQPLTLLSTEGRGHFVGCYLNAWGTDGSWMMLEGDERIRVDGEATPSWQGTGLEDYFNGAWYYMGIFDRPLHGLLEKSAMRTAQYRWHLLDRVGFDKRIDVEFEFGQDNISPGYMSAAAYWYQDRPVPANSRIPPPPGRVPPQDRIMAAAVMAHLFEFERLGRPDEALARCRYYAEACRPFGMEGILNLRAAAYREAIDGIAAARLEYASTRKQSPGTAEAAQADALLWFHDSPTNALLGTHVNGRYKLYLDGNLVAEGDHPQDLKVARLILPPGNHEFAAEVTPTRADAWFSMCLRTHVTNLLTDAQWERVATRPPDWPLTAGAAWTPVAPFSGADMLPRIGFWQFSPNAFVGVQSGIQLLRPWLGWPAERQRATAFVRRRFSVPSSTTGR
jgi:hypothetical protein